jgi:hypothetical protein
MADMNYRGLERPPGLRATDLVQELERLALEWGDRRFAHAVRALRDLGIVNERGGFSKKRGPHAISLEASAMDYAVAKVWDLMKERNFSEQEASAVVATDLGWGATRTTRFESAVQHLRQASGRARRIGKRARG